MNTTLSERKPLLVIGYGDQKKSDEGAGCYIAETIEQKHLANIAALSVPKLTPSLASFLVKAKTVIFINSYFLFENMKPEIIIKHFLPYSQNNEIEIDYPESPYPLLSFTNSIYHQTPNAFWILIPAINHQHGKSFSGYTQEAIEEIIAYLIGNQYIPTLNTVN